MTTKPFTLFAALLALLLLAGTSMAAISLGSVTGARTIGAFPGDTVSFELIFFNIHDENGLTIDMEAKGPEGWNVFTDEERFELDFHDTGACFEKNDYECLNTGQGRVMARPIRINVEVPWSVYDGEYIIRVSTTVSGGDGAMSMHQTRNYQFVVVVGDGFDENENRIVEKEYQEPDDETENRILADGTDGYDSDYRNETEPENQPTQTGVVDSLTGLFIADAIGSGLIALIIVLILLVSWRVYKRD